MGVLVGEIDMIELWLFDVKIIMLVFKDVKVFVDV